MASKHLIHNNCELSINNVSPSVETIAEESTITGVGSGDSSLSLGVNSSSASGTLILPVSPANGKGGYFQPVPGCPVPFLPTKPSPLGSYTLTETQRQRSRLFRAYISRTHTCKILIRGKISVNEKYEEIDQEREYLHRWTSAYRKAIVSKFYQLQDWWEKNPAPITLMTLTTYQDLKYRKEDDSPRLSIEEGFTTLKKGWRWLSVWLRKYFPNIEYVQIMEPQRSGYPHLHVVLFGVLPKEAQEDIRRLWSEKYKAGSFNHGVDFSIRSPDKGIKSIRNYLMKYIAKTLINGKTGSKFENEVNNWTPGELLFNATIRAHKWRLWGASLVLSEVMAYKKSTPESYEWLSTDLKDENGEIHHIRGIEESSELPGQAIKADLPDIIDDVLPESSVTLALWQTKYTARNRALGET